MSRESEGRAGSLSFQACVCSLLGAASPNPNSFKTECGHWQVLKPSFPGEPCLTTVLVLTGHHHLSPVETLPGNAN